jgi:hypothetical protein
MPENKTRETRVSPLRFIRGIEKEQRRKDGLELLTMMTEICRAPAKMWGPSIVGFGKTTYTTPAGRTGEICKAGFSPRKSSLVLYVGIASADKALLAKLGKHKTGVGCLYINTLDDIDRKVLRKLIADGYRHA